MTRSDPLRPGAALLLLSFLVAACGGGGGSPTAGIDAGGVRAPVATSAAITAFGSVVVGGVRYDTAGAEVIINGEPGSEAALAPGQQVDVTGTSADAGSPEATRIAFSPSIVGPIDEVDLDSHTLVVLGQAVRTDASTSFDPLYVPGSIEGLDEDASIAVSGVFDSTGRLFATRIEPADEAAHRLRGVIVDVDESRSTLTIGGQLVDYGAAMIEGFDSGRPSAGDLVVAIGQRPRTGDPLEATRIEYLPPPAGAAGEAVGVIQEGFVTRFVSEAEFDVDRRTFSVDAGTVYVNGTASDLGLDMRITAIGVAEPGAETVRAGEVRFRRPGVFRLEAPVESVSADGTTLTAAGVTIVTTAETRLEDQSDLSVRIFSASDLGPGDQIEVRGFESGATLVATRIEREDDEDDAEVELTGLVRSPEEPRFFIAGAEIVVEAGTEFDDIDRDEFFASGEGTLVTVEGVYDGARIVAEEVEAEESGDIDAD